MDQDTARALQEMWARWVRGSALRKGTRRYQNEAQAYVQGALTALHATGRMSTPQIDRITWQAATEGVDSVLDPNRKIKCAPPVPRRRSVP